MSDPCWLCGAREARPFLRGTVEVVDGPEALKITDSQYGHSLPLVRCGSCDFVYASPAPDDLSALYALLDDPEYVEGRESRLKQMRGMLDAILQQVVASRAQVPGSLLDVGAGSGLMVEAALERGLNAVGVEPSHSLVQAAQKLDLPVLEGVLPSANLRGRRFDLVTCIDVIEHVRDPVELLVQLREHVNPGGLIVVATPDVDSAARRLLGRRWWHFRVAHVCFFPTRAFTEATRRAGLTWEARKRQTWWFEADYLAARVGALARSRRLSSALSRLAPDIVVPVDPRDSWVYYCRVAA